MSEKLFELNVYHSARGNYKIQIEEYEIVKITPKQIKYRIKGAKCTMILAKDRLNTVKNVYGDFFGSDILSAEMCNWVSYQIGEKADTELFISMVEMRYRDIIEMLKNKITDCEYMLEDFRKTNGLSK